MAALKRLLLAAVTVGILAILFVQIAAPLLQAVPGGSNPTSSAADDVVLAGGSGQVATGPGESASDIRNVRSTVGDAVRLTGANDSEIDVQASPAISGSHELCTVATADASVTSNDETRVLYQLKDLVLYYNGTTDRYEAWYYDDGSRESTVVGVAANDATAETLVCGQVNASTDTVTIYRNTTQGSSEVLDGDAPTESPPDNNWNGTIDETRVYNRTLTSSQRSEYNSTRALAVTGAAPALRITYDSFKSSPDSVATYFSGGGADLSNASLANGVSGPALTAGTDYTTDGDTISVAGGQLDGEGEVVYADYDLTDDPKAAAISAVSTAVEMIPVIVIVLVSAAILVTVRRFSA
jgi:hypothetical protein